MTVVSEDEDEEDELDAELELDDDGDCRSLLLNKFTRTFSGFFSSELYPFPQLCELSLWAIIHILKSPTSIN